VASQETPFASPAEDEEVEMGMTAPDDDDDAAVTEGEDGGRVGRWDEVEVRVGKL
jgi:hypothetical protein